MHVGDIRYRGYGTIHRHEVHTKQSQFHFSLPLILSQIPHLHILSRELYMKTGQGFLLVFSITSQSSLNELSELRETIIRIKDDENVPIVIVGNKSDLEQDRMVSRQAAFNVSQSWGNAPYYETSARRRANVDEVFIDLCRQIIRRDNNRSTPEFDDEVNSPVEKRHHRMRRLGRCVIL
ncbi:putative ras small monomeric gtpase protein [Botrytis fragariae]|uniref:Putative ras small monomeric gtpase protein n=1 Tax=Botrytis fragariae TaxID=1964551 RepID=A0A8H6B171_9HELO|nr:putative ras small monomeric gtpase protein [Botrytis fragariae]KAF5877526.1 putative ras small monomeric gtpase protein [Botrytis fragariae]